MAILTLGGERAYEDDTFERFPREWAPDAYDAAMHFDHQQHNLYFWGRSQLGKTHLTNAICHRALDRGLRVVVVLMPDFKETLRRFDSTYDFHEKERYLKRLVAAEVLALHEMGSGTISEPVQEQLRMVLEKRLLARRNGVVMTSNYPPMPTTDKTLRSVGQYWGGTIGARIRTMCGVRVFRFPDRPRTAAANQ